jgi:hypothetical protein
VPRRLKRPRAASPMPALPYNVAPASTIAERASAGRARSRLAARRQEPDPGRLELYKAAGGRRARRKSWRAEAGVRKPQEPSKRPLIRKALTSERPRKISGTAEEWIIWPEVSSPPITRDGAIARSAAVRWRLGAALIGDAPKSGCTLSRRAPLLTPVKASAANTINVAFGAEEIRWAGAALTEPGTGPVPAWRL